MAGVIQEIRITTTYLKKWWALERFPYKLIMVSLGLQTVSFCCVGNTFKHTQIILGKLVLMEGTRVWAQSSLLSNPGLMFYSWVPWPLFICHHRTSVMPSMNGGKCPFQGARVRLKGDYVCKMFSATPSTNAILQSCVVMHTSSVSYQQGLLAETESY